MKDVLGLSVQCSVDKTKWKSQCRILSGFLNGLKLLQGEFRLDTGKNVLMKKKVKNWNRLPTAVVESSSVEIFKRCGHSRKGHDLEMGLSRSG